MATVRWAVPAAVSRCSLIAVAAAGLSLPEGFSRPLAAGLPIRLQIRADPAARLDMPDKENITGLCDLIASLSGHLDVMTARRR